MLWLGILLFPIYEHFRGPGGAWVTHYCSRCGIRLVVYASGPRRHYIHATETTLLQQPPPSASFGASSSSSNGMPKQQQQQQQRQGQESKRPYITPCPSPLGPPNPVDTSFITNHTRRYQHLRSTTILHIDVDPTDGLPSAIWRNAARTQKLHRIDRLNGYGGPNGGAFHARFLWPGKFEASECIPLRWAFGRSCLSVVDARDDRCVGAAQLAQQSWDTVIYLPQQHSNSSPSSSSSTSSPPPPPPPPLHAATPHIEHPRLFQAYDCRVGQDRQVFARQCPQFFVPGPHGSTLLWTVRRIVCTAAAADDDVDVEEEAARLPHGRPALRLVLLDAYDRLVAANDGAWTTRKTSPSSEASASGGPRRDVLRVYAPADDHGGLVGAVVTSYAVLCAQLTRRMQWNDILRNED
ncbi:hypothetical protein JDV02_004712 [Purpureocillium takamizusanense]|nr:uncharacterized protein JDV02_004712 [Purpureocillium takamizusanense]UNI18445.1 hypothetical protein JDV02_004712 [Purpureocillium takamizusanense]